MAQSKEAMDVQKDWLASWDSQENPEWLAVALGQGASASQAEETLSDLAKAEKMPSAAFISLFGWLEGVDNLPRLTLQPLSDVVEGLTSAQLNQDELEDLLGELSGSESSTWTTYLRMPKRKLLDRLIRYKGLQLVTLGLFLWHREPIDHNVNFHRTGLKHSPLAIDNSKVVRQKLEAWTQRDLADFAFQIEQCIVHSPMEVVTIEAVEQWLWNVADYLKVSKAQRLWKDDEYRKKLSAQIKKVLDKSEAGSVLWLLVKE